MKITWRHFLAITLLLFFSIKCGGLSFGTRVDAATYHKPPSHLIYGINPAVYTKGVVIAANTPSSSGGAATSYSVSPVLPTGLRLDTVTGIVSGTPTAITATAPYSVTASNAWGSTTADLSITINDAAPIIAYASSTHIFTTNIAIEPITPTSSGGVVTTWSISPTLPTGLDFSTTDGTISGKPTTLTALVNCTVTATNSGGSSLVPLAITVNPPAPSITTFATAPAFNLPAGFAKAGASLTFTFEYSDGQAHLKGEGVDQVVTGNSFAMTAPATPGNYDYVLSVKNAVNATETRSYTVSVVNPTSVSGVVYAPNGLDPIPNALVYLPGETVQPFAAGVSVLNGANYIPTTALAHAITDVAGTFTLTDLPPNTGNLSIVIQVGKWRRQVEVAITPYQDNPQPVASFRLPSNKAEGDIPLIALVTGGSDAPESIPWKMGIDASEFSAPTGTGRIHFFQGSTYPGVTNLNGVTLPSETTLWNDLATLSQYDVVIFACQGNTPSIPSAALDRLVSYANQGGRVWAAHYGYTWLNQTALSPVVTWNPDYYASMNSTAVVDQSFPGGQILAQWLQNRGASTTLGNLTLANSRSDVATVIAPAQNWLNIHPYAADLPMLLTFNTPVDAVGSPATSKVGRILYTDFHFEPVSTVFPLECGSLSVISTNERVMEFMFLNLLNPLSIP